MPTNVDPAALVEDRRWQRRMLPWMVGGLLLLSLVFFAATIWHYSSIQSWLAYTPPDLRAALAELESQQRLKGNGQAETVDAAYREWYARMYLEAYALNHRYRQNAAVIYSRVWNGYMGFLTGMVLALSGCVFILGKLREGVDFTGEAAGAKWTLITSSPGIVLAIAGSVLVGMSLKLTIKVESKDVPVYLPQLVELADEAAAPSSAERRPTPVDMAPAKTSPGGAQADIRPIQPLPESVQQKLKPKESSASSHETR